MIVSKIAGGLNETGFDIVIGNPPYVKVQNIPKELTLIFKNKFSSTTGKYDLYVLFIENSFNLKKKNGCITFINPHRFLISEYGEGLRNFLFKRKAIKRAVYFGVEQIFETATTYTGIFIIKDLSDKLSYAIPNSKNLNALFYKEKIYNAEFNFNFSIDDDSNSVLNKINVHKRVSEIFEGVYQGIIPMGDDIQVLKGHVRGQYFYGYSNALNAEIKIEKEIAKPLLKGENIQRYSECNSDIFIFYPHYTDKKGKTKPFEEKQLKTKFPLAYDYISNFKKELKEKKIKYKTNPDYWYSLHRSREQFIFETEKIITPQLQNKPCFTLDKQKFYADAGGYMIVKRKQSTIDLNAYLGIFNSKLFYYFIQKTSTPYNNNYYYFKTNYIEPFGIPELPDKISKILSHKVELIINRNINGEKTESIETEVDKLVYQLYNLSNEEIAIIEAS